jgi:hypothetical protein
MVSLEGGFLPLEDLSSIVTHVLQYGVDEALCSKAAAKALSVHIENMSDNLSDLNTMEELDDYEEELARMMGTYGVEDEKASRAIERKRQRLYERDDSDRPVYSPHVRPVSRGISDDQIRSMFSGLQYGD